jgi:4-hydroxy-tetrahydrodipicolinate reductase
MIPSQQLQLMKIALIGYGKMGKMTEEAAIEKGHQIVSIIDPKHSKMSLDILQDADLCIDFSHPDHVFDNIKKAAAFGKNLVVGTTGWYELIPQVKEVVSESGIGLIYSPNFSLGIHLFFKMIKQAAALMNAHDQYDVGGFESHHQQKVDTPSGTANALIDILLKEIPRKNKLNFPSLRCGSIPGTHAVIFDSPADSIELKHTARNRKGFAYGAIAAGEWLQGKKGFYTLDALFEA